MYHDLAIKLIMHSNTSMAPLTEEEAHALVRHMHPYTIPAGTSFLVEDARSKTDFMLLILSGEVLVESQIAEDQLLTLTILQPGRWAGELSMFDSHPRLAACRASEDTDVVCAILNRQAFLTILDTEPRLAAKVASLSAANMAQALREMHQKMCRYAEICNAIRTEL